MGAADAIEREAAAKAQAEFMLLERKAAGMKAIVESCGGADAAFKMLMLEHMDTLAETSATAISNIKFDKVVVWDGGSANGEGPGGSVPGFIKGVASSLPPTLEIMKEIAGIDVSKFADLGKPSVSSGALASGDSN